MLLSIGKENSLHQQFRLLDVLHATVHQEKVAAGIIVLSYLRLIVDLLHDEIEADYNAIQAVSCTGVANCFCPMVLPALPGLYFGTNSAKSHTH